MNTQKTFACLLTLFSFTAAVQAAAPHSPKEVALTSPVERYVSVDNVCAWPNLTVLRDGTIAATIFNRPTHGQTEGAVDVWASADGRFWEKRGVAAPNEPNTNRMNVAAGLARNGDLLVLSSGWSNIQKPGQPKRDAFRDGKLPVVVCRSADGGRTWSRDLNFPGGGKGWDEFVPFGDILIGTDGALHMSAYQGKPNQLSGPGVRRIFRSSHFRSDDDGKTWRMTSVIGPVHNETTVFHLGGKRWMAAARQEDDRAMDLFRSNDDGETWEGPQRVTGYHELNAHLTRLKDGRLLLSYGNRSERENGPFGVLAKLSSDEGETWSTPIRLLHSVARDCGYPSSVQRPDGAVVTAYYSAGVANHSRYHMGTVIWTPPGL